MIFTEPPFGRSFLDACSLFDVVAKIRSALCERPFECQTIVLHWRNRQVKFVRFCSAPTSFKSSAHVDFFFFWDLPQSFKWAVSHVTIVWIVETVSYPAGTHIRGLTPWLQSVKNTCSSNSQYDSHGRVVLLRSGTTSQKLDAVTLYCVGSRRLYLHAQPFSQAYRTFSFEVFWCGMNRHKAQLNLTRAISSTVSSVIHFTTPANRLFCAHLQ